MSTWTATWRSSTPRRADRTATTATTRPPIARSIAFLSDYGTADEFVGVVHAVLHRLAPDHPRIDVTHQVPRHDVRAGSLTLWRAAPWLAPAVILAVVDPGVATLRRAVAVAVDEAATVLVGPDNGLLLPAALRLGAPTEAVELDPPGGPGHSAGGATFAGRDLFAPAAARAATGVPLRQLGRPIDPATLAGEPLPAPIVTGAGDGVEAEVLWVDHFGNVQLNVTPADTGPGPLEVQVQSDSAAGPFTAAVAPSYAAIPEGRPGLVVDSYGLLALCLDRDSAASRLGLRPGDRVRLAHRVGDDHR